MNFDVQKNVNELIKFIQKYYHDNNLSGAVIGISGGKDSAVWAALLVKSLGKNNVYGLWLPCKSNNQDYEDAKELSKYYDFHLETFDIFNIFNEFEKQIKNQYPYDDTILFDANINIKPRIRMMTLYYYAAMLSSMTKKKYIVIGTSNKCEKYVGYFTKGGDNVCDLSLLGNLKVSEVIAIGNYLRVPNHILYKDPSDGLRSETDEDVLGVKYLDIEKYLDEKEKNIPSNLSQGTKKKIEHLYDINRHKYNITEYQKCD